MDRSQTSPETAWRVWSVSALLLAVSDALAVRFPSVAVRGDIGGFSRAASGHCYFTLKDASQGSAGLRCVMFRRAAALVDFAMREGIEVEVRGRLSVYDARGELQLVVESVRRVGAGSLFDEFLRLKAALEAQGLFDPRRKRPLPAFARCVGVVTSATGAAVHDVVTTLARRSPHVRVVLVPAQVQGAGAVASLVEALAQAQALPDVEVLLLCRGGGSAEDLAAFNAEPVVRAVAAARLPVIVGVGHETDVTLVDWAADVRAPTPTAAAEMVVPATAQGLERLQALADRLARAVQRPLERAAQQLDVLALRLREPARWVGRQQERLNHWEARVQTLDPRHVLARGYTWMEDAGGAPVLSVRHVQPGQTLRAVWADGQADVQVEQILASPAGRSD